VAPSFWSRTFSPSAPDARSAEANLSSTTSSEISSGVRRRRRQSLVRIEYKIVNNQAFALVPG
jgi:hypothetical protein